MHRSFGDSVLIAGACLFASWTAFCYVLVLFELSFSELRAWSFVPFAIGLVIMALCKEKAVSPYHRGIETVNQPSASINIHPKSVWLLLILTLTAVTLRSLDLVYWLVWVILLSTSIIVFRAVSAPVVKCPQVMIVRSNWVTVGIAALMVFGAALVAFTHRPDQDDSQYLNFVVTAIDFPFDPLFSHSGLWQEPGVPLEQPIYRFHTYELLIAALSDIFNVPHKTLYYLILAPIFGGIAVLVHWRLAEYLVPQYALSVLLAWLVLIIALGASHQEFGNFAFVRLFQSKSLLVTIGLPLCLLLGLRFAEVPDVPRALTLGMGIIASTGLTTSALATVPFVVGATLCGGLVGASRGAAMRLISGGLVSGLFLCAIGFFLIASTKSVTGVHGVSWSGSGAGLSTVLGDGVLGALILVLFPIAPLFVVGYKRQKLYALTSLIFVGLVVNPWMADFLAKNLNEALAWRLFWSVPFVTSTSISLVGLTALLAENVPRLKRQILLLTLLILILGFSEQWSISSSNRVVIASPRLKVEPEAYILAEEIVRRAPLRSTIYAPFWIAEWIPTFHMHPYPLVVRPNYFNFGEIRRYVGVAELDRRRRVTNFLQGQDKEPSTADFFQAQLSIDRPTFVVYDSRIEMGPAISQALTAAGYVDEKRGMYRLWHLP